MAHYQELMPDPLKAPPTIYFTDDTVISGITPMERGRPFDEIINRPQGMPVFGESDPGLTIIRPNTL